MAFSHVFRDAPVQKPDSPVGHDGKAYTYPLPNYLQMCECLLPLNLPLKSIRYYLKGHGPRAMLLKILHELGLKSL